MFDILLFLYDNYLVADQMPDADALSRKLSAVGFEAEEIDRALAWLSALNELDPTEEVPQSTGTRCFSAEEQRRIDPAGLNFLLFLERDGMLPMQAREWVLTQALALEDSEVSEEKIKWIALLAISRLYGPGDALWLEDLVRGGELDGEDWTPTLH